MYEVNRHPCFADCLQGAMRLHLPIAPDCNIQCRYCVRRFDCANECRPGVCSRVLTPEEATRLFCLAREKLPELTVVGVAGPGDALANFSAVKETLAAIRRLDKEIAFCLSTNGLRLTEFLPQLQDLGVRYLTVTVNAVTAAAGEKIYARVQKDGAVLYGREAFSYLWKAQQQGIRAAVAAGICCKINTVVISGINEGEASLVARQAAEMGCYMQNLLPLFPVPESELAGQPAPGANVMRALRRECGYYIRQMEHCQRCRADAIGSLAEDIAAVFC